MKRKANFYLRDIGKFIGWAPAETGRKDLLKSRREFKRRVRARVKADDAEWQRLRKSVRGAKDKRKLEQLFHEVYGREENPMTKRRSPKKKTPKKGKMPAGLRKYWAKKRRAKNSGKRRSAKRNPRPRIRYRTRTVVKYRTRTVKVRAKRRRRPNPVKRRGTVWIHAPAGLGRKGLEKFRRLAAKAYRAPARIVRS